MYIAVVDDEADVAQQISDSIRTYLSGIECTVYTFITADHFFNEITNIPFDAVFLDIDMPDTNGFTLTNMLRLQGNNVPIVYVTGYENLVIQSFRYKPLGFVRKNHLDSELQFALETILSEINKPQISIEIHEIRANGGEIHYIPIEQICFLESMKQKHMIEVTLIDKHKILSRGTLNSYIERPEFKNFVMINSGTFANIELFSIDNDDAVFANGIRLKISRRKLTSVIQAYQQYKRRVLI